MIPNPSSIQHKTISKGREGTAQTVELMAQLVSAGAAWPYTRPLVLKMMEPAAERDFKRMADNIARWIAQHMTFRNDPFGVEALQTIPYMLASIERNGYGYGDCDDFTMLMCALCKAAGFPTKIRVIRYALQTGFSHVVPVIFVRGHGWKEYDLTIRSGEVPATPRAETKDSKVIL